MLRLSLRAKVLAAFALVLLPVLALLLYGFRANLTRRRDTVLDDQFQTAKAVALRVEQEFDSAIGFGSAVANAPVVESLDPERIDPHLRDLLRRYPEYDSIAVFNARGENRGWANLSGVPENRVNVSDRPSFREAMATNSPVISDVLRSRTTGAVVVSAVVPIRDRGGRPIGGVVVTAQTSRLAKQYEEAQIRSGQALFLISPAGRIAFHTGRPNLSFEESDAFFGFEPVQAALSGSAVKVESFTSPLLGDDQLGAFVPTPRHRWAVAATMPRKVALAPVREDFRHQLFLFALILLFSAGLAVALERYTSAPIRRLEDAARALGRGDLGRRVDIQSGDELERLGRSFNEMAAQLQRRSEAIARLGAESQQRAQELSAVFESITDMVVISDPDGKIVEANPAALRLMGATSVEDLGDDIAGFHARYLPRTADGRPLRQEELPSIQAARGEIVAGQEMLLRTGEGRDVLVSASGSPVPDPSGRIALAVLVARDVTEEKQRAREDEALVEIGRALVQDLELEAVAGTVLDQSVGLLRADKVLLWLANVPDRELDLVASRNVSQVDHLRRISFDEPLMAAVAARTGEIQRVEDFLEPGGEIPEAWELAIREQIRSMIVFPLKSRGRLVGVLTYAMDTVRRFSPRELQFHATIADLFAVAIENAQLYQKVREALRLREEFLAAAAHELKTPVATIKLSAETLMRLGEHLPRERRWLMAINRQVDRIAHLVEDLLIVVRLREQPPELHTERFDVISLLEYVTEREERVDAQHPVHLEINADQLMLEADRGLVRELLVHLVGNAMKYSPAGSRIEVSARRSNGAAEIVVQDHGVGISPEHLPHVFEPFYEPVPSGSPGYVGVISLGLHLSKQIVEAHGGRISCESTPETGSTFRVTLPLVGYGPAAVEEERV
ncbi:MAG: cache domain-containing protein [Myxococcaceae bacterium]